MPDNLVEGLFAAFTEQQLRRGMHRSVPVLEKGVLDYFFKPDDSGRDSASCSCPGVAFDCTFRLQATFRGLAVSRVAGTPSKTQPAIQRPLMAMTVPDE